MSDAKPKTYVLVGDDHNGAFTNETAIYGKDNANCEIIRAQPGQSIEDALKKIKGPANVIVECHGGEDGTITWNKDESIGYDRLLGALPRTGVESVTISSCYGGSAMADKFLVEAPEGTVVQSRVGAHNENISTLGTKFAETAHRGGTSTELFVESLAAFDPKQYHDNMTTVNNNAAEANAKLLNSLAASDPHRFPHGAESVKDEMSHAQNGWIWVDKKPYRLEETNADTNPAHAMPHMIGIGGVDAMGKPNHIDMQTEVINVSHTLQHPTASQASAWSAAQEETHRIFSQSATDATHHRIEKAEIDAVAQKMQTGAPLAGVEETRIAYALTASYMEQSGDLKHRVDIAKNHGHEPALPVPPDPTHDKPAPPANPTLTAPPDLAHTDIPPKPIPPLAHPDTHHPEVRHAGGHGAEIPQPHRVVHGLEAIENIVHGHHLVTEKTHNHAATDALKMIAQNLHIAGISTTEDHLSKSQIEAIQGALHVKKDGLVGEHTLEAMEDKILALSTPKAPPGQQKTASHTH